MSSTPTELILNAANILKYLTKDPLPIVKSFEIIDEHILCINLNEYTNYYIYNGFVKFNIVFIVTHGDCYPGSVHIHLHDDDKNVHLDDRNFSHGADSLDKINSHLRNYVLRK